MRNKLKKKATLVLRVKKEHADILKDKIKCRKSFKIAHYSGGFPSLDEIRVSPY